MPTLINPLTALYVAKEGDMHTKNKHSQSGFLERQRALMKDKLHCKVSFLNGEYK
jgi:hypothetical protein